MAYRDDLAYGDEYGRGPNRWDRSRFERARSRGPPIREMESVRIDEDDRRSRGGRERDIDVDVRFDSRRDPPRRGYEDDRARDRYYDHYNDDRGYGRSGQEIAPWRDRYDSHRDPPFYETGASRLAPRQDYHRRQASWDAFDRRPLPRYGDREEERDLDIDIRISNERGRGDPRIIEREYRYPPNEDDYRDVRVVRERSIVRRAYDDRDYDRRPEVDEREEEVRVEVDEKPARRFKKGRTKFPKRLAHIRAIIELNEEYDEEEDFFLVHAALRKENIDDIIRLSEIYKSAEPPKQIEAPPTIVEPEPQETEIVETVTRKIIENPDPSDYADLNKDGEPTPDESASNVGVEEKGSVAVERLSTRSDTGRSSHSRRSRSKHHHSSHRDKEGSSSSSTDVVEESSDTRRRHRGRSKSKPRRDKSRLRSSSRYVGQDREEVVKFEDDEIEIVKDDDDSDHDRDRRDRRRSKRDDEIILREKRRDIKEEIRQLEAEKRRLEREEDVRAPAISIEKDRRGRLSLVRH